ncbi:threonylcarbamoyl-AMP synthase [Candidatus Woesearchaeota archaeon]|nr:threonylcarbamoyl-AMP synthase [Candidatus Woesearchaeota archaeon]
MRVLNKDEYRVNKSKLHKEIEQGAVFVHPTDTIYGIGCDATNTEAVKKIREAKQRKTQPFSVIAPSSNWVRENCEITPQVEKWLNKLPGPYTLIVKLKKQNSISKEVMPGKKTIGIRRPDHWISELATEMGKPIVTTSANIVGHSFMTSLETLNPIIKAKMNFILYEGEKKGKPSSIIDLTLGEGEIIER